MTWTCKESRYSRRRKYNSQANYPLQAFRNAKISHGFKYYWEQLLIAQRWIPRDQRLNATKECTRLGQQFSNNVTNIDITSENNEYQFKWLQPFVDNELGETTNEVFINEMLFYGKVWSIAHTAVNKCVLHHDHEFVSLIKDYLNRVHIREDELIEQQETSTHTLSNLEGTTLVNSRKMVGKGRSKAASHKNTMNITLQEVDNILADFVRSQTIT
ncbi:hypothetical protein C2G38_2037451 [Gigaspora rosea]|uniref:Uncharacterized protein n=1 Tax=Gigaspora rosea TaxID=44941 RepID=A0A397V5N5_9GLOM|nr:hypothetical protein C2G38_2037451 [Gigaspora rosea]